MKILMVVISILALLALAACDLNLLSDSQEVNRDSKNSTSTNTTNTTTRDGDDNSVVNPAGFIQVRGAGETISQNAAGETIITSSDGSVENVGDVNNPLPDEGGVGILFLLACLSLSFFGCVNTGEGQMYVFNPKTSAGIQLGYQRGSAQDTSTTESGKDTAEGEVWIDTQGGGQVDATANTKVGQGDDAQSIGDDPAAPAEDPEG